MITTEYLPLLGGVSIAVLGIVGVVFKALLDGRGQFTDSALKEIDSLRKDSDAADKQISLMRQDLNQSQRDSFAAQLANITCERRCADLTTRVHELETQLATLKDLVTRWQALTGQMVPP